MAESVHEMLTVGGVIARQASFFYHSCACFCPLPPDNLEYFLRYLRIYPIASQFMMMTRAVVESGGCDILHFVIRQMWRTGQTFHRW